MFDNPQELIDKIRLGEDSTLELKSVRFKGSKPELSRDALADEIAAFANSSDGVIVFGVDDNSRRVEGMPLEGLDALESMLSEVANDSIKPSPYLRMIKMTLPDADGLPVAILKLDIPRSLFVHRSPGGYFCRIGDKKREMSPEALARLFQQRSQVRIIRFDEQPVPSTSPSDLDENLWRRFAEGLEDSPDVILDKLRLVTKDDAGEKRLSVAGVLLATKRPASHIPNALIEAVAYRGMARDSNYQLDARTIDGPIDEQVREGIAFVRRNMRIG
ncbi:MAG: RNA-binding domain-containing protein, partial [Spirochaetota bacterium]